ncbi:MAG: class I mannose-6-phosphate isomerase [Burkholderiales bacterium]|nr:class I mannose-6-phosphate isomerase [Phycisphaerae bacterium]
MLYPMIFAPRFVEKMWGGRKLASVLNKPIPPEKPIGESWELFDFPPGVVEDSKEWISAVLTNGPLAGQTLHQLVGRFGRDLHGDVPLVGEHGQFPILIKFLDAREDLSVQVHPPQSYADTHPGAHLKNEAWYAVQSDPGARILKGLVPGTTQATFEQSIKDGTCEQQLGSIPVKLDDCHYLPSGTVHALGAGCLVAEVQTPSDTTYRVFDFNRIDPSTGSPRTLHVQQALDCIDFTTPQPPPMRRRHEAGFFTTVTRLVQAPQFMIEKVRMSEGVAQKIPYSQPVVWIMLQGEVSIAVKGAADATTVGRGTTVLLPANMADPVVTAGSDAAWLEVTFPDQL